MTEVEEKVDPLRIAAVELALKTAVVEPVALVWLGKSKLDVPEALAVVRNAGLDVPEAVAFSVGSKPEVI